MGRIYRQIRNVRHRGQDVSRLCQVLLGCKGQSEVLVAVFWGWGNAEEVRRGKCIRATALRKNTYFSTIQERALNCPGLWQ